MAEPSTWHCSRRPSSRSTGTHPSQSHRFRDRAQPIAQELQEVLASHAYAAKVEITYYHLDRIVLYAALPPEHLGHTPAGRNSSSGTLMGAIASAMAHLR